jgi:SAM-dependent methyltransferase
MNSPSDSRPRAEASEPYYRRALALVHDRGFAFHATGCAPGIIDLLTPVLVREGLVLELGCGSGLLTKELIAAGHRVIATDASPAMLDLAAEAGGDGAVEVRRLTLPDDPLPSVDAIVAIGHPLNYVPDVEAIERALGAMADALRPGGMLAFDLCDLSWGVERRDASNLGRCGEDWAIITRFSMPAPDRFVRDMTVFVPDGSGRWRRDDEHQENVLVDTATVPPVLARRGVKARVAASFGAETLPPGLHAVIGERPA